MSVSAVKRIGTVSGVGNDTLPVKNTDDKKIRFFFLEQEAKQLTAKEIAQALFDDLNMLGTGKNFESNLGKLNKDNIVEVLQQYKAISASQDKEESLIGAIYNEMWFSRSTPKHYVDMIFKQLELKSEELRIDNNVLKEKQQAELASLSDSIKVNFGFANSSALELFADEMVKRIGIKEKLISANECKFNESSGNISADAGKYNYVKNAIVSHGVSTSDILGNGKIDNKIKQVNPNCWAIAGINAFLANKELNELLNSLVMKKDGITSVYIPEADEVYSFTEKEIVEGTKRAYCIGDGDAVALLMAVDEHFKTNRDGIYTDSRDGSLTVGKMLEILTGLPSDDKLIRFEDMQPQHLYSGNDISTYAVNQFISKISQGEPYAGVFCFYGGVKAERVSIDDENKKFGDISLSSHHVYTIQYADEDYVYLNDSNFSDSYLRIPHSSLQYALDGAIYKYR